ncbi:MAG: hypothetical protein ACI4QR_00485 [Eubacteriales bacterium]
MKNNTEKSAGSARKKIIISVVVAILVLLIAVPVVTLVAARTGQSTIKFLIKNDLGKYVQLKDYENLDYAELREALCAGYDVFRVSITEEYSGTDAYVDEGCTIDFTLSAHIVEKSSDSTKYISFDIPEEYAKTVGYRPYSEKENLFFDDALACAGNKDSYGQYYLSRDKETQFTVDMPENEKYGELSGKTVRFTIKVTDYVSRYLLDENGIDASFSIISDWYAETASKITKESDAKVEAGDVILYDCIDRYADGTEEKYENLCLEVTEGYVSYFAGYSKGGSFSENIGGIEETFTVKAVYKAEDIERALAEMGYKSVFDFKEELRIWCYAVYSDGLLNIITSGMELSEYPKKLMNTYSKLEDEKWETDFRSSAASLAATWGDEAAFTAYGITGFDTFSDYLDSLLKEHTKALVRSLVITYSLADKFGIIEDNYAEYEKAMKNYMSENGLSKSEALNSLSYNGDEACIFYTEFLSSALGVKLASFVTGADFTEYISYIY